MHTITCKLNQSARQHSNEKGVTFFVSLGEKNYNYQTRQPEWTNYEAALFAKDKQIQYYTDVLVEGSIVCVSATGVLVKNDEKYGPKLILQDAKLAFAENPYRVTQVHKQGVAQVNSALGSNQPLDGFEDPEIPFANPYSGMYLII